MTSDVKSSVRGRKAFKSVVPPKKNKTGTITKTFAKGKEGVKNEKDAKVSKGSDRALPGNKRLDRKERQRLKNPEKFDLANKVKKIWEELRSSTATVDQKRELAGKLLQTVKGNAAKLVSAHDTSRVLQTLLKFGTADQRDEIFEEMKSSFTTLFSQRYAMHYLFKVLEYGSAVHRQFIVKCIIGNTRRLLKNPYAAKIVEEVFSKYAKPNERRQLVGDLCGVAYRRLVSNGDRSLKELYNVSEPEIKDRLLRSSKAALVSLASFGKGRVAQLSVVHAALDDFLTCCPCENPIRNEVMEAWRENIHGLLSSKTGVHCALHFVWESNTKERKLLVKGLKPIISDLVANPDATAFILAIFDSCDDVVLVNKYIVKALIGKSNTGEGDEADPEYCDGLEQNVMNPVTRRLLLYLLSPRDPNHFSPTFISQLTSPVLPNGEPLGVKKSFEERLSDLRQASRVDDALADLFLEHLPLLVKNVDKDGFLTVVSMLNKLADCEGKRAQLFSLFALLVEVNDDDKDILSIESPPMNIALKRLIIGDKDRFQESSGVVDGLFSTKFLDRLSKDSTGLVTPLLSSNRGCFALIHLMECQVEPIAQKCCQIVKPFISDLRAQSSSGAKLLLKKLS